MALVMASTGTANAAVETYVGYKENSWFGATKQHVTSAWMNVDHTNRVLRAYTNDRITPYDANENRYLRASLFEDGYNKGYPTTRYLTTNSPGDVYTDPTYPCGSNHGFRSQAYAYTYDSQNFRFENTLYSELAYSFGC